MILKLVYILLFNMDSDFFDITLNYNWDMETVDRSFDNNKIKEYLSHFNETDKLFINEIINKTLYIKYNDFSEELLKSLEKFIININQKDFYIMLSSGKIGSENWIIALLWDKLRKLNVKGFINENSVISIENIIDILIIDDAIYSGNNMLSKIDYLSYNLSKSLNKTQRMIGENLKFHIVVPYISVLGEKSIINFCKELNITYEIYTTNHIPTLDTIIDINKFYPDKTKNIDEFLYEKLMFELITIPAIYFDHKVAGPMSTFSTIYIDGILPNNSDTSVEQKEITIPNRKKYGHLFKILPSRAKIQELIDLYKNYQINL